MAYGKDFDSIFNNTITAYLAATGKTSITSKDMEFMLASGLAATSFGLYEDQKNISKQIFPSTSSTDFLDKHAYNNRLVRNSGETNTELLARILSKERQPAAGGNILDFKTWALESSTDVAAAHVYPASHSKQDLGIILILILADLDATGSETPDSALLTTIKDYIVFKMTTNIDSADLFIASPIFDLENVTLSVTGSGVDLDAVKTTITDYMNTLAPGGSDELVEQRLINENIQVNLTTYRIAALALGVSGVDGVDITVPSEDIIPDHAHIIRPDTITVT